MDQELEAIKPRVNQIRSRVEIIINSIKALGEELTKVEIKSEKVASQYMPVIKDAKKTIHTAIKRETSESLPEIRSFDDVLAIRDKAKKFLNRLGDTSGSHRRVLHSFFPKQAKILKLQLGLLNRETGYIDQLVQRYTQRTSSLTECSERISKISAAMNENADLARRSAELKEELETAKVREAELAKSLDDLQRTESFRQYKVDKEELAKVRREAEALLAEIGAAFSKISRPVGKYTYEVGLDKTSKNLIQSVMNDSMNLIRDSRVEEISEALKKVREAVRAGRVVVKNPDKDVENITTLMNRMQRYVDEYREYDSKMQAFRTKTSPIETEFERLRYELERIRNDVAQKASMLDEFARKLVQTRSWISAELERIEELIEEATSSRIKVRV